MNAIGKSGLLFGAICLNLTLAPGPVAAQYMSSGVQLLAQIPNQFAATSFDIWGWTDPATSIDYALIGSSIGVEFYDLSDPTQPNYVGRWLTNGFDFKVYGQYAYSVRDVLDLSVLRGVTTPQDFVSDASYFPSAFHNVFINEQTGYLYGSCPSIMVYDLSEPLAPTFVDLTGGGCHDAMSVIYRGPDARYAGREILFGSQGNSTLAIYDVDDKDDIQRIALRGYGGNYAHQGWPSEDHRYFFQNDELDSNSPGTRTHVFDIQDLEEPQYLGYYVGPTRATDHNLYIKGDLLYMANYSAGVRIVQVNDAATLDMQEIAFFDTHPESDGGGTGRGAFTVYPFFESGILIASDMQRGLFVLQLDLGNDVDFDDDGTVGCADVDALVGLLATGETRAQFDLTHDGLVTADDLDAWRVLAGEIILGPGMVIPPGDANLDGTVDGQDFVVWNDHKFSATASWCQADFTADGLVDGQDFVAWNDHKFGRAPGSRPVPESVPDRLALGLLGAAVGVCWRRRRMKRRQM